MLVRYNKEFKYKNIFSIGRIYKEEELYNFYLFHPESFHLEDWYYLDRKTKEKIRDMEKKKISIDLEILKIIKANENKLIPMKEEDAERIRLFKRQNR
jgi:hypothetical protein